MQACAWPLTCLHSGQSVWPPSPPAESTLIWNPGTATRSPGELAEEFLPCHTSGEDSEAQRRTRGCPWVVVGQQALSDGDFLHSRGPSLLGFHFPSTWQGFG